MLRQVTKYSNVTASLLLQPKHLGEAIITLWLVIPVWNAEYRQAVPSNKPVLHHLWLCSINLKPTLHPFLQSEHLNRYKQHHSLAEGQPLLYGEIEVPYNKSQFKF